MKWLLVGVALIASAGAGAAASWLFFGASLQINVDLAPGTDVSIVPNEDAKMALFSADEAAIRIDAPCLKIELDRAGSDNALHYQEMLSALRGESGRQTYFDGQDAKSLSYTCAGVLYAFNFDERGNVVYGAYRRNR